MKLSDSELQQLYQRITAHPGKTADCLDEDILIGELTREQRDRVAAHIAGCSDCARAYRIARSMRPFEAAARATFGSARESVNWLSIAAAAVLVSMLPALIWLGTLQRQNEQSIQQLEQQLAAQRHELLVTRRLAASRPAAPTFRPQIGAPIIDLDADVTRGAKEPQASVVVPATAHSFTLILHLPGDLGRGSVDVEIVDVKGTSLWHERVAPVGSTVTLGLDRRLIPAGTYTIRVVSGRQSAPFRFRVDYR